MKQVNAEMVLEGLKYAVNSGNCCPNGHPKMNPLDSPGHIMTLKEMNRTVELVFKEWPDMDDCPHDCLSVKKW